MEDPTMSVNESMSDMDQDVCGESFDHDEVTTYDEDDGFGWECRRCGAEGWEDR